MASLENEEPVKVYLRRQVEYFDTVEARSRYDLSGNPFAKMLSVRPKRSDASGRLSIGTELSVKTNKYDREGVKYLNVAHPTSPSSKVWIEESDAICYADFRPLFSVDMRGKFISGYCVFDSDDSLNASVTSAEFIDEQLGDVTVDLGAVDQLVLGPSSVSFVLNSGREFRGKLKSRKSVFVSSGLRIELANKPKRMVLYRKGSERRHVTGESVLSKIFGARLRS